MLPLALAVLAIAPSPAFRTDVQAVLSRAGCNSGPCHGNLTGKGGFKLSLRGDDPAFDWVALTRQHGGRRADPHRPDDSLILLKGAGRVPHEGGTRFAPDSPEYAILRGWIAAGARLDDGPRPTRLEVTPAERVLFAPADRVTLRAVAHYPDGSARDVTPLASFETSAVGVATVRPSGEVVKLDRGGEVVVTVRFLQHQAAVRLAFLPAREPVSLTHEPRDHPIDRHVLDRLEAVRVAPAPVCDDATFVRRLFLDVAGVTPTPAEVRRFLADPGPDKRTRLIDDLLGRPEYVSHWAQKWADLLRVEEKALDRKGVHAFHRWLRDQVAADRPLTELAADVVAARGHTYQVPPAGFYRAARDPYQRAESVAQVFLGLRVGCARCHNHPFDRWTQDDYHRFAAVFARVDYRVLRNDKRDGLDKHEFVGEQVVVERRTGELAHPRGGDARPRFLGGGEPPADGDRRAALATWLTDPANPFFAPAQANRVWRAVVGRGLVEPNDDFRATNPARNPALLTHLTEEFARHGYRVKPLVRHVVTSRTYQRQAGEADDGLFARAVVKPLEAEQLLDALGQAVGRPVGFPGYPAGTRAGELAALPQTTRRGDAGLGNRFLKAFGKPERLLTCECERAADPGVLQAFQMLTGELAASLVSAPDNRIGSLLAAGADAAAILDELFLAAVARPPTADERAGLLAHVAAAKDRRAAWEDVTWGLVNSKGFLLRR
jgi:hypothetical protein